MGKTPYHAALEAADEIGLAVIAISATIIAVFVPVAFMGGIAGQFFKQFGLTVAVAVFFSLLVARLLTPMMAAYFLRGHGHAEPKPGMVMRGYLSAAEGDAALPLADACAPASPSSSARSTRWACCRRASSRARTPAASSSRSNCRPAAGSTTRAPPPTRSRKLMLEVPEVENVYVIGGASPTGTLEPRRATVVADLKHKSERDVTAGTRSRASCSTSWTTIPDLRAYFVNDRGERQLAFGVMGTDGAVLDKPGAQDPERDGRRPESSAPSPRTPRSTGPKSSSCPISQRLAELGISTATLAGDAARRHDRRHRREPRQVHRRRPPDPDPRAAQRGGAATISRWSARCRCRRPSGVIGAAVVGGDDPLRPGAVVDRSASTASGASSSAPTWRPAPSSARALARSGQLPAVKDMPAGTRIQETGDAEIMGEVFAGFATAMAHRPDAGAGGADPAVRLGVPLRHHPRLAAAGDRRRGGRRSGSPTRRSRCRW